MSGMSDYALEVQLAKLTKGIRGPRHTPKERNNVPTVLKGTNLDEMIAQCIKEGVTQDATVTLVVEWNSQQASPIKIGLVKKAIFRAFFAATRNTDQ